MHLTEAMGTMRQTAPLDRTDSSRPRLRLTRISMPPDSLQMHPAVAVFTMWTSATLDGTGLYGTSAKATRRSRKRITVLSPTAIVEIAVSTADGRVFATSD